MRTMIFVTGLVIGPCYALASFPIGRGEISATIDSSATYDSNVFATHESTSDYSATLNPHLSYLRKAGQIEASAGLGISFIRYREQTQLDADNIDAEAALRIDRDDFRNYSGAVSGAYRESSEVNTDINARINTKTATFIGQSTVFIGPKSDFSVNGNYSDTQRSMASDQDILTTQAVYNYRDFFYGNSLRLAGNYDELKTSGGNVLGVPLDQNSYTVTAGLNRAFVNEALTAGINYGYRVLNRSQAETATGTTRQEGSVISATLDGPFLPEKYFPKIRSQFSLSYEDAATPGINDPGTKQITGALRLNWKARELTNVSLTAYRSQRLSVDDLSIVSTNVQLGIDQKLRYNLTGSFSASYDWSTYRTIDREDKTATVNALLKYHFARSWDARLSYLVTLTSSNLQASTFNRHVISLGLTYQF